MGSHPKRSAAALLTAAMALGIALPPQALMVEERLQAPNTQHWFGTDELGRDVLLRTFRATRNTTEVVAPALLIALVCGLLVGVSIIVIRGKAQRWLAARLMDVTWSLPGVVLIAAASAILGRNESMMVLVFGLTAWVPIARFMELELRRRWESPMIIAARALGASRWEVVRAVTRMSWGAASSVVLSVVLDLLSAEAAVAYVGLGLPPPAESLGSMVRSGVAYAPVAWWMLAAPLLALASIVLTSWLLLEGRDTGHSGSQTA